MGYSLLVKLVNWIYWVYDPVTNLILTSWDILVGFLLRGVILDVFLLLIWMIRIELEQHTSLAGDFKYGFLFTPKIREMIKFD